MSRLFEDTRSQLVSLSRGAQKEKDGKTRYEKRRNSRISSSVREYNSINMNSLFKADILTVNIPVHGETDDYTTTISFGGFLKNLHRRLKDDPAMSLKTIIRSLIDTFNSDNVYIRCNCPDFFYRFGFWLSKEDIIYGEKQLIPSDITNPENKLGRGCKHTMLVLSNHAWLLKVASVIWNYINYMEKHSPKLYQTIIYPALYEKEYEEVQLDIFGDETELETDKDTLDKTSEYGRTRTQFKKDNPYRFQPKQRDTQQITIDDEVEET